MSSPPEDAGASPGPSPGFQASLTQLDPSTKDYAYYVLSDETGTLAEIIVTATAAPRSGGDFEAGLEYWKIHRAFDTREMTSIEISMDAREWPSTPFTAREASFVLPTGTRWESKEDWPHVSSRASFGLTARITEDGGVYAYSIAWYNQTGDSMFRGVEVPFTATMKTDGLQSFKWFYAQNGNQR